MDDSDLKKMLPHKDIFECEGIRIGLTHSYGAPFETQDNAFKEFEKGEVDMIIHGHSHLPYQDKVQGVFMFNPGSPNDHIRAPYCSYGIIEIDQGKIIPRIIKVKDHG